MTDNVYVATGANGVEHTEDGPVAWVLPEDGGGPTVAASGRSLSLRRVSALLDVLEADIFEAEAASELVDDQDDVVTVNSARLTRRTGWNPKSATVFAIDCAAHSVSACPATTLPDGTAFSAILDDARRAVEGDTTGVERLHYWARVSALRRVHRDRTELENLSQSLVFQDEANDVDALDDPRYESVVPVTDAVLAAIEALRHHLLPHLYTHFTDHVEEALEAEELDRPAPLPLPQFLATPVGTMELGIPKELPFEPAWSSAREAARHARLALKDLAGPDGEAAETEWQATKLAAILKG